MSNANYSTMPSIVAGSEPFYLPVDSQVDSGSYAVIFDKQGVFLKSWETTRFIESFKDQLEKIINVSDEVISALKRNLDYNGYYTAYLLDQLSEDEFDKISEEFSVELMSEETEELRENVRILFRISREKFTPSDLSNIFKVELPIAENILAHLKEQRVVDNSATD